MNESECKAHAFAELVRKQTIHIAGLIGANQHKQAAEAALKLCTLAAERKLEIEGEYPAVQDQS